MKNFILASALLCLLGCSRPTSQSGQQSRIGNYEYGADYPKGMGTGQTLFLMWEVVLQLRPNGYYHLYDRNKRDNLNFSGRYAIKGNTIVLDHAKGAIKGTFKGDDIVLDTRKLQARDPNHSIAKNPGRGGRFIKQQAR